MEERIKVSVCDLRLGSVDPRANWDSEACEKFNEKHKQVIDKAMPPYCLRVCGNCEYLTVAGGEVIIS